MIACAGPAATDAGLDAGAPFDAGVDAPIPIAECGDGVLEPMESCDDEGRADGDGCDAECRFEARCGDGALDSGEACDDGELRWNDGCDGRCASEEQCGNGVLDLARGEACDDGDVVAGDGCDADCRREGCGDGVLDPGEACDDGDGDPFGACGLDCRPRVTLLAHTFSVPSAERGCDVTGDGLADNALAAWLRAGRAAFNGLLAPQIGTSTMILLDLRGLDDPWGEDDDEVLAVFAEGVDGNDDPTDNLLEGAAVLARAHDYPSSPWVLSGSIRASQLALAHGTALVRLRLVAADPCALDADAFAWPFARARLEGTLGRSAGMITHLEDGLLCGALPVSAMAAIPNPFDPLVVLTGCDGSAPTLADLLLGGASGLGITLAPVHPDADLDGDGLERFELETDGPVGCQPVVRACVDGDGTRHEGRDCAARPEFADGVSAAIDIAAVAVRMIGTVTDAERCP